MQSRRFGRTGLSVPAVTYGGGWVGGLLIHQDFDVAAEALDRAVSADMDWIDTAASYGDGASETVIGRWLAARAADERPRISTKFRIDPAEGDFAGQIRRSVEASFQRLGVSRVEVVTLHNQIGGSTRPNTLPPDAVLGKGGVADVMQGLSEEGLFNHLGMTALGEPALVRQVVESGRFDVAQVYYNAINPTAGWSAPPAWNTTDFSGLLAACQAQDMGTMGIRIFAAGHLATTERHDRQAPITANSTAEAEEARVAEVWKILGPEYGTPAQAALRFGLSEPALSTIVVGLAELDHLDQVLAAEAAGPLPDSVRPALEGLWRTHPAFVG